MNKGYTVEVMRKSNKGFYGSDKYDYKTAQDARRAMREHFTNSFCILTEWAQFEGGIGDYEVEIERQVAG